MKKSLYLFSVIVFAALVLSACGSSKPTPDAMMHDTPTADMMHETPTADAMMVNATPTTDAMMQSPMWFSTALTDANSGKMFMINDFQGKVVLVNLMAVQCDICKQQQEEIKALHDQIGMHDDFMSVSLDVDAHENLDTLKSYLNTTGFDWPYAVASPEVTKEIMSLYGDQFLNPQFAPIVIIDRHSEAHPLPSGLKRADELLQAITKYLKAGM